MPRLESSAPRLAALVDFVRRLPVESHVRPHRVVPDRVSSSVFLKPPTVARNRPGILTSRCPPGIPVSTPLNCSKPRQANQDGKTRPGSGGWRHRNQALASARKEAADVIPADAAHDRAQEAIDALRAQTDEIIADVIEELRFHLRKEEPASQRRVMRTYGTKFAYQPGEPLDMDDVDED